MIACETCRVCGSRNLMPVLSLGEQYVSDFVPYNAIHSGVKAPIELDACGDCTLVQARYTAPQELLYRRHYWYRSGVTQTMRDALYDIVLNATDIVDLKRGDIALDIGSNDGTLLRWYGPGIIKVGVEPALNLQEEGQRGIDIHICDFWSADKYKAATNDKPAKIVTAIGMFYDLDDPNTFIHDVARVLAPDGVFIAQLMCLKNMLNTSDLGNLAHEHLEFYTLRSLDVLFHKNGLKIFDIQKNNVNGESYRIFARHIGYGHSTNVTKAFADEFKIKDELHQFFINMESNKQAVHQFVCATVATGKRVWVYGASTKGNVILQYYGLDSSMITGAADRSPEKWGKYTIGTGILIHSEEHARRANPDYFLVLPYAFLNEFVAREDTWRQKGGKFIVPLPKLRIV